MGAGMLIRSIALMAGIAASMPAWAADTTPYREYEPMERYTPSVEGDVKFSNTYRYWKDRSKLDPVKSGNPDEYWKLNWKFMDPPFNPAVHGGHFALDHGEERYQSLNHTGSFAQCLGAPKGNLKGLRTAYPRYRPDLGHIAGLEEVIERCAEKEGVVLQNGSYENSAVSLYVASKSNGMPIRIDVSKGPMKDAFERGRKLYHTKSGRLNFACASCHIHNIGKHLRGNIVTTPFGDVTHFPVYRTRYMLQSLQLRMIECQLDTGAQPLRPGSSAYTDLEVFLTALSNGYTIAVPSERD
jgi:sulfur-oxidizing protein SoxA